MASEPRRPPRTQIIGFRSELLCRASAQVGIGTAAVRVTEHRRRCAHTNESKQSFGRQSKKRCSLVEHGRAFRWKSGVVAPCDLLDANVLITAHNSYYPIDTVPEFWTWLVHKGRAGDLKIPLENY